MKSILFFLTILVAAASCKENPSPPDMVNMPAGEAISYLALGDSYTIGESVSEGDRWPVILANDLRKNGIPVEIPRIIAVTGWTTRDLLSGLQNYHPEKPFGKVSLLIGVNNQYQGRDIEEFRTEFRELLLKSIQYAGNEKRHVFVLSIPDWGVTPFGESGRERISKEIDQFNSVIKDECAKEQVLFVDITPISRKALTDPTMLAKDRLHFSGKMHQLWVNEVLPKIKTKL